MSDLNTIFPEVEHYLADRKLRLALDVLLDNHDLLEDAATVRELLAFEQRLLQLEGLHRQSFGGDQTTYQADIDSLQAEFMVWLEKVRPAELNTAISAAPTPAYAVSDTSLLIEDLPASTQPPFPKTGIDWPALRRKIRAILWHNGLVPTITYLRRLMWSPEATAEVLQIEKNYDTFIWKLNHAQLDVGEWEEQYLALRDQLEVFLNSLQEGDLAPNWQERYLELLHNFRLDGNSELFALISRADLVQVPKQIVTESEQQRYKRLLYLYQDAFTVGNYAEAYEYCRQAQRELEVESAQLYEYLLLSYFRMVGSENIIAQVLRGRKEGEADHLKHILNYAGRILSLQDERGHNAHSLSDRPHVKQNTIFAPTAGYNIQQILSGLLMRLLEAYAEVPVRYLLEDKQLVEDDPHWRMMVRILLVTKEVNRYLRADVLYAEATIHALCGGNKNSWIVLGPNNEPTNRYAGFDALRLLEEARRMLTFSEAPPTDAQGEIVADTHSINVRLADDLLGQLDAQYHEIRLGLETGRTDFSSNAALVRCLKTYRVAALLFPQQPHFHRTVIEELSGEEAGLRWFKFNSQGALVQNEAVVSQAEFDALDHLQFHVAKLYGEADWAAVYRELVKVNYKQLVRHTQAAYDKVNSSYYRVDEATYLSVQQLVNCLENWLILYYVYQEKPHLDNCLEELLGNVNFHWFAVGKNRLVSQVLPNNLAFDATLFLDRVLRERNDISTASCYHTIGKNYYNHYLTPTYRKLVERAERFGSLKEDQARLLWSLLEEATVLYAHVDQDHCYRDFVIEELTKERLLPYFDQEGQEIIVHDDCEKLGVNPLRLVKLLRGVDPDEERLQAENLVFQTVYNRRRDLEAYYQTEFHPVKRRNFLDEDRLRMVELLDRFYQFYLITKDKSMLEIPYREYVLNRGKIRWGRSLLPSLSNRRPVFLVQHWRNANLAQFSYRMERRKIWLAYREESWLDRLRWW